MKRRKFFSITIVFIVIFFSLNIIVEKASARWRVRNGNQLYEERVCQNGMLYSNVFTYFPIKPGIPFGDWQRDYQGNIWSSKKAYITDIQNNKVELENITGFVGPREDDQITGIDLISNVSVIRWSDLYNNIPPGGEIPIQDKLTVKLEFNEGVDLTSDENEVTSCEIEDSLPAPSLYQFCGSVNNNLTVNFPADIKVVDLDVSLAMTNVQNKSISGTLISPDGKSINLFENIQNKETIGVDGTYCGYTDLYYGSPDYLQSSLWFDDEGEEKEDLPESASVKPNQELKILDGSSALGTWTLSLTDNEGNTHPANLECLCMAVIGYRTVRLANSQYEVNEDDSIVNIPIELSEPSTKTTTVQYSTVVAPGSNQQVQSGTVTFSPGQESKSITIPIMDDTVVEADETVTIILSNPSNQYGLDTTKEATLTIVDDDFYYVFLPAILNGDGVQQTQNPFTNPGFENGSTGWTEYSAWGYSLILNRASLPRVPHAGNWAVWLGGDYNEISYIAQQVTVPASNPVLSYWHYISSEDVCGFDFGFVVVNNSIVNTYNLCASNNTNGWVQKTVNLSAYAGQTVNLQIRAETDGYLLSSLYVDDVSFQSSVTTVQQSMNAFPLTNSTGVAQKQPNILSVEN